MRLFDRIFRRERPAMEGGDEFAQVLARHLVAQAFGEGELPDTSQYGLGTGEIGSSASRRWLRAVDHHLGALCRDALQRRAENPRQAMTGSVDEPPDRPHP